MSQSEEEIQALIKANEAEEQIILGQAMFQESSNEVEQTRQNNEMAALEREIAALEKEYNDNIKEMAQINDAELAREEQALDTELQGLVTSAQQTDLEYDAAMKKYEQELAAYNAEIAEAQRKSDLRDQILKEAGDFMALGLIPTDYSGNDDAIIDLMYRIKKEAGDPGVPFGTTERVVLRKYNEFVKAFQQFGLKYRKDIEKYNLEYQIDGVDIRKVGEFYMPFGLRHVLDAADPARMGGIVRPYWRLKKSATDMGFKKPGVDIELPAIVYSYNGSEWVQDSPTWIQGSVWGANIGSNKEKVYFDILGRSALSWTPQDYTRYQYAGFLREFDDIYRTDFSETGVLPKGNWQLPMNYRVKGTDPTSRNSFRHDERLAFQRCPAGYWFRRGIPEETSQCVYMGDSMVDYKESFYPAYLSPKVFAGRDEAAEYDVWQYNIYSQQVERIPRTKFRSAEEQRIWEEAQPYKKTPNDNVVVIGNTIITTESVIAQNAAAGGVLD